MKIFNLEQLVSEALAIEVDKAREANALGYMARALVQATMPHSKVKHHEFKRKNGAFKLTMLADSEVGLPYGSLPRLLIAWVTTEAVRTKEREITLGNTLSEFMSKLGLIPTGGRWGSITRLRDQMKKLFAASISCTYDDEQHWAIKNVHPVVQANLWWDPKLLHQSTLFRSTITLGEEFFKEVITHPIPIDMRALRALKRSPMALDIYCWLTYRMSYLRRSSIIPWEVLQIQFGADYASTSQGLRDFKRAFLRELKKVQLLYPEVRLENLSNRGVMLLPGKPHVPFLEKNKAVD